MVKQTTRDRMIEKASQLIREYGYQNIPLRKLASLLGVTTGAFYKAFENKEDQFSLLTNILTPIVLISLGVILPILAKREKKQSLK